MITASILILSALKSYFIVGLISVAILPRSRQLVAAAMRPAGLRRIPAWAYALYCAGVAAMTAVSWPGVLRQAYLQPQRAVPQR